MVILPSVGVSRPAIILSVVVFPQPEGPRRVMKSLSSMTRFRSSTATNLSNLFVTCSKIIFGISTSYALVDAGTCQLIGDELHQKNDYDDQEVYAVADLRKSICVKVLKNSGDD